MTVVLVLYAHRMGAAISVHDDIPATMVDRLSVESENGGLVWDSAFMEEFYKSYGDGKEVGHSYNKITPNWTMINDKCAIFCMNQAE